MQHGIREFRPRQPLERQLNSETLNRILRELESLRITKIVNGTFRKLPGGTEITVGASRGGGSSIAPQPWDLTATQDPDNENQYLVRVRPGTLSYFLPTNWDDEFALQANQTYYAIAEVTTDGKAITSVTIKFETSAPESQQPELFAVPTTVNVVFGIFSQGAALRTIGAGNITLSPKIWFQEARTNVAPGESLYNLYYVLAP